MLKQALSVFGIICLVLCCGGCCDKKNEQKPSVPEKQNDEEEEKEKSSVSVRFSREGESCCGAADCEPGLRCVAQTCMDEAWVKCGGRLSEERAKEACVKLEFDNERHTDACFEALQKAGCVAKTLAECALNEDHGGHDTEVCRKALNEALPNEIVEPYLRKALTSEAIYQLNKIYMGAVDYYSTPRLDPDSNGQAFLPCRFPDDAPLWPGKNCNDSTLDRDGDGRCDEDRRVWYRPPWLELKFEINDPHYFVYSFDSEGEGDNAQFTASAHGDLDGDGIMSTFQRYGKGMSIEPGYCRVSPGAALYTYNELE